VLAAIAVGPDAQFYFQCALLPATALTMAPSPQLGLLLRLPHDVLVDLFVRLKARAIGRLAATCRLLQYGQSSP
jgi:hypothetical protein